MSEHADLLVDLALELYEVGQSDDRIPFLVELGGPRVAYRLARVGTLRIGWRLRSTTDTNVLLRPGQ